MARKTFDFAFVQSRNLEHKWYPVEQATVSFEVTGADDPLTLQRMRDAVSGPFAATQKKINEMIPARAGQIARLSLNARARKEDVRLIDGGNAQIQRWLDEFKGEADGLLEAFAKAEKKKAERIEAAADGITAEARKEAESALDEQLQAIVSLSNTLKRADKQLTSFKLYLGAARQAAKKSAPQGWLSWIGEKGYDLKDVAFDLYEGNYAQAAKGLSEKVIDKLIKTWSVPENVVSIG